MRPLFQMQEGDVFSTAKLRKGMENLRKLYGEFGYIDFVPEPVPEPLPGTDKIDLTFNVDEGKQFFVRRIDFSGNTTTRDKVIRRELLIDEGDIFNTRLVGNQHPAPEPARIFRAVEGKRSGDDQSRHEDQHRRYHSEGEGARQELHSVERRRLGYRGQLYRLLVFDQQLPRSWRNAEPRFADRRPYPERHVRFHRAVLPR